MTVQQAVNATAVTVVTTAETVAAVMPLLEEVAGGGGGVLLQGYLNFTAGTAATTLTIRVRQGSTTAGALVGTADVVTVTPAALASIPFAQLFAGLVMPYGNQFCVTVQQAAATGNGTVNDITAWLDSITPAG